jgi:hypothetical protein
MVTPGGVGRCPRRIFGGLHWKSQPEMTVGPLCRPGHAARLLRLGPHIIGVGGPASIASIALNCLRGLATCLGGLRTRRFRGSQGSETARTDASRGLGVALRAQVERPRRGREDRDVAGSIEPAKSIAAHISCEPRPHRDVGGPKALIHRDRFWRPRSADSPRSISEAQKRLFVATDFEGLKPLIHCDHDGFISPCPNVLEAGQWSTVETPSTAHQ